MPLLNALQCFRFFAAFFLSFLRKFFVALKSLAGWLAGWQDTPSECHSANETVAGALKGGAPSKDI